MTTHVTSILSLPGGGTLVAGTDDGAVCVVHALRGVLSRYQGLGGAAIQALAVSSDHGLLMAATMGGRALIWESGTGEIFDWLKTDSPILRCGINGPHEYFTVESPGTGALWTPGADGLTKSLMVDSDGRRIEVDEIEPKNPLWILRDGFEWLQWDPKLRSIGKSFKPVSGSRMSYPDGTLGLSHGGRFFYVYWDDLLVFETGTGKCVREQPILRATTATDLSADGARFAIGMSDGRIVVLGTEGNRIVDIKPTAGLVSDVMFATDGKYIAFRNEDGTGGEVDVDLARLSFRPADLNAFLS